METQEEYLDRICNKKPKNAKKKKKKTTSNSLIFGYEWEDIQAMQQGTYKPRTIKWKKVKKTPADCGGSVGVMVWITLREIEKWRLQKTD